VCVCVCTCVCVCVCVANTCVSCALKFAISRDLASLMHCSCRSWMECSIYYYENKLKSINFLVGRKKAEVRVLNPSTTEASQRTRFLFVSNVSCFGAGNNNNSIPTVRQYF